ncbi:alcohol dehydrogenase catalytic domain-containing protein [Bradyrhizobium elkanii]|uniref:alcohol dehydrogenase catalytic domain-containing protein n=1 Tax=Bradyrhizobium elkanii TaxID=29448 RepID=UPI0035125AF2
MKAVQVVAFGRAADVVKLNEVPDVGSPGPDEVVVAVEAAPINNSDFMIIAGRYGYLPSPPATLGIEGVGRVVATGSQVRNLKEGDRTLIPFTVPPGPSGSNSQRRGSARCPTMPMSSNCP